ncbi:MFS transporter [Methanoplanus endosymbiosus]|uniref:MFS transporter n=1 Tax=Methanoplanus endosymbiosus TaxID=33865 RepID=A0A9E7PL33_9EURY|nr:MFS transporter [Methanoplanus endosymbiosus]UUX92153.1 MFS transporter [Methanoplanus endosymbiosus]
MKERISILLGMVAVMALSNAVVPVLPFFADESPGIQGAIFSAYFFGAFLTVFPAGTLSDRIGKIPLIRAGLIMTIISGLLIYFVPVALPVVIFRFIEGIGAGMFVVCAMSWVNEQEDHKKLAGYIIAALNLGLLSGLVFAGALDPYFGATGGVAVFTVLTVIPLLIHLYAREDVTESTAPPADIMAILADYKWLYLSALILVGATGVVTALYPEFTDEAPLMLSFQIGIMNFSTIVSSVIAPKLDLKPVPVIRAGSVMMGFLVIAGYFVPEVSLIAIFSVFSMIGLIAGFIMVGQMEFLAETGYRQGTVIGLLTVSSYAGMTFLPFFAGIIAEYSYLVSFVIVGLLAFMMSLLIGRCRCTLTVK